MPVREEKEEVLWPYGILAAVLTTTVWMITLSIIIYLTEAHFGWPSPEMFVIVFTGLAFYGFIPLILVLLDRAWLILYGTTKLKENGEEHPSSNPPFS